MEDRCRPRVAVDVEVSSGDRREAGFRAVDVSSGGLALVGDAALEPGELLQLSFELDGEDVDTLSRVVWCREVPASSDRRSSYLIGLQFQQIAGEQRQLVESFVARCENT